MAALRTRKQARERALQTFRAALDRMIPEDESVALQGRTFRDFELQVQTLKEAVIPTVLEERAALDAQAQVAAAGACPHCGSNRTYLEKDVTQKEIRSPDGPLVLAQQHARCRACNGSFSPAAAGVGLARGRAADESGGGASGA